MQASLENTNVFHPENYFDLDRTDHRVIFENVENVWEALPKIENYLQFRLKPGIRGRTIGKPFISNMVFVGRGTVIEQGAMIKGPAWIGEGCEIRNGCYIRENVIIGNGVVLGNSCEFKNCLVFDEAQIPHFNYVGDSILGFRSHLGAGVVLSNTKLDHAPVSVISGGSPVATGLRKFGAIIGDFAEVGCNAVLSPGSLIGKGSILYPGTQWRGALPSLRIVKTKIEQQIVERRV